MSRTTAALLECMPDPMVIVSADTVVLSLNKAFAALFDIPAEQFKGRPLSSIIGIPEREFRDFITRCCRTSGSLPFAAHYRNAKGENVRCLVQVTLLDHGQLNNETTVCLRVIPQMKAMQGFHTLKAEIVDLKQEIAARQRTEAALRISEAHYRDLIYALPAAIYTCNREGHVSLYNQAAAALWGREPEVGKDFWCGSWKMYRPDGSLLPLDECPMAVTLREGRAVRGEEIMIERPDGTRRHVLPHPELVRDADGVIIGAVNMLTDITDRQEADRAMANLAAIVTSSQDAIIGKNLQGIVTSWNRAAERLFGYTAEEMLGQPVSRLIPPDRYDEESRILQRLARNELIDHYETIRRRKDGTDIYVSLTVSPVVDSHGRVIGASKIARDISEQRRAEEALRVSEQEFRSLAEAVPQLVWVARPDGWNIYFNQQWVDYTGLTLEESYGYGWDTLFHADDKTRAWDAWQRATQHNESYELECRLRRADGVYRWWLVRGVPTFNTNGKIQKWVGTCTDIEDLKQAERALQENAKRLRLALEAGQMGAWDVDLKTHTTSWDDKEYALLGFEAGSVEPSPEQFYRRVHPDDLSDVKRLVDHALKTGRLELEFRVVHPDGQVRWLAARGHVFHDDQGLPVRIVGVNFDVTDRRSIEEQLRSFAGQLERVVDERTQELVQSQARLRALAKELNLAEQRERKRLAGELHDYLAQLLVLGCLKLGQVRRAGLPSKVEETVKQTEEVLNQALNYSRTLMAELSPPVLQAHGLAAGLKWLGEQMQRHGLRVRVEAGDASSVSLPEESTVLLFQSVRELLMNALKHADSQQVVVRLQQGQRRLCIEVRDDGVGFDLAAASDTSATALSSKFGLFSIRERMAALGGWFHLQSTPGEGTTATLVLPLALNPSVELEMRNDELPEMNAVGRYCSHSTLNIQHSTLHQQEAKMRVLLVDDHAMVRQGLRRVLDSYVDVEVVGEAWNGEEAVECVEQLKPSVVVMDINMPKMNGIEATARIKARHPEIVVIGLSVNAGGENETTMKHAGAALLLTKEAAVDELYRVMQETLKGR